VRGPSAEHATGPSSGTGPQSPEPGIVARIERLGQIVAHGADRVCALLFALVFLIFCYKIARRYLAGDAVAWADEVSVVLFIWIVFLANGLVVPERRQIAFDLLHRHLAARWQRRLEFSRALLIAVIFAVCLPGTLDYIHSLWREKTPVLLWRLDRVYACFGVFAVAIVLRLAWTCLRLLRRDYHP